MQKRIVAIGDIHGCYHTFKLLLDEIKPSKDDRLILLGDYIDRGLYIKEVIDLIIQLRHDGYDITALMGNHESMLLDSMKNILNMNVWIYNGAEQTLKSFGVKSVLDIEEKYIDFFKKLSYYTIVDNYLFVHAGFNEDSQHVFTDTNAMLWARKEVYSSEYFRDKIVIHGHTPIRQEKLLRSVEMHSPVINIDTGCVYAFPGDNKHLSAIEIPSFKVYSVQNADIYTSQS